MFEIRIGCAESGQDVPNQDRVFEIRIGCSESGQDVPNQDRVFEINIDQGLQGTGLLEPILEPIQAPVLEPVQEPVWEPIANNFGKVKGVQIQNETKNSLDYLRG